MLVVFAAVAIAADPALDDVLEGLSSANTVSAAFTQTQHRRVLTRPLESAGQLVFVRPDKLRWQVDSPSRALFVMDGSTFTTAMPDLGITEEISLASQPEFMGLVQGLLVWLQADATVVTERYDTRWDAGRLVLEPKEEDLSRWVTRFTLTLADDLRSVTAVDLLEADGDRVAIAFSNVRLDADVDPRQFQLK